MKKFGFIILALILLTVGLSFIAPGFGEKRSALGSVGRSLLTSDKHHAQILRGGRMLMGAEHNHAVIARASDYMGHFGTNTGLYRRIAEIAAEAEEDCPRLEDVLDLAARRVGGTPYVLELAELACQLEGPEEEEAWQQAFESLSISAEYATVEEALAHKL